MSNLAKKKIYLYCNEEYGSQYLEVFKCFAKTTRKFKCYVVFSSKGSSSKFYHVLSTMIRNPVWQMRRFIKRLSLNAVGIRVFDITDINHPNYLKNIPNESIGFIAGFNQIFNKLSIAKYQLLVNFHPSLLPYYRGAIPSYWVIKNNEVVTGVTAHIVSEKIDSGEIIYQEQVVVNPDITEKDLDNKIATIGSFYFDECLSNLECGMPFRRNIIEAKYQKKINYSSSVRK